jgi:hypothetical protein
MKRLLSATTAAIFLAAVPGVLAADFSFHDIRSLSEMRSYLTANFPLGTAQSKASTVFEGAGGQHYSHPEQKGVEKWVYDINLCRLYVWRWNISANFDASGRLTQIFVNGDPVHGAGDPDPARDPSRTAPRGGKQAFYKVTMPRPEASLGESSLTFTVFDTDTSSNRQSDLFIFGGGPSNADPANMGSLHAYATEAWRSIFDEQKAKSVVNFAGRCP